ncbi:MAG TPA: alpha/beta hydrolase [Streptosporangiaceae bacterium]|nr:alpha/beta hydrolase [Streptosporangiaceae bacterium]
MTTFALVHGAWHGAWCWMRLGEQLRRRGHDVVAMDLPCEDPAAGCARYAEAVTAALDDTDEDVALVGHSLGGLTIPLVAARRPVRRLIFLCALLPEPGRSLDDQTPDNPTMICAGVGAGQQAHPDGSTSWHTASAASTLYPDCTPAIARWAARQLRRQNWRPAQEVSPLTRWPATETRYILCANDAVISADWARQAARDRLGTVATELQGGHSPFLCQPAELADVLIAQLAPGR